MKKHIPNAITCCNLLAGCLGILFALEGKLDLAAYAVFTGATLDFFDGLAARMLKAYSPIGQQLDSLADMVTFGTLPGMITYSLFKQSAAAGTWLCYVAFFITIFSALRLAKFNIDERQTENFIGLPTPANTLFIATLPLIGKSYPALFTGIILQPAFLTGLSVIMSFLLVAELPLFSLKFKQFGWSGNELRYILLIASFIFICIFTFAAIPLIVVLYILLSLISYRATK